MHGRTRNSEQKKPVSLAWEENRFVKEWTHKNPKNLGKFIAYFENVSGPSHH